MNNTTTTRDDDSNSRILLSTENSPPPAPFSDYVTEFLLRGPRLDAELPREIRREFDAVCAPFGQGIAAAWTQHEDWLRAQAEQRGIRPRFAHDAMFFAEAIRAGERKGKS